MELKPLGSYRVLSAAPFPLGARPTPTGARFAIFSRHATHLWLELYDEPWGVGPTGRIALDPAGHRVGDVWALEVEGLRVGQLYGWRAEGPWDPARGLLFNPRRLLIDPYARAIVTRDDLDLRPARDDALNPARPAGGWEEGAPPGGESGPSCPKCVVVDPSFDWGDDRAPRTPVSETVIYEMHVRGFTRGRGAAVDAPGTFAGVVEKIPYLQSLGVTAVELLPLHAFDHRENPAVVHPETGEVLGNYWGYSPLAFFAPPGRYARPGGPPGAEVREFKEMVRALHRAGIEIILDVVFNHTGELQRGGPTVSFRGLDNPVYYLVDEKGAYRDYTGCGNTINANHPVVRDLIVDCLRYWTLEMHVDGFRFDLASVLTRGRDGKILPHPPLVERIAEDAVLSHCKLIAEPWDAVDGYQLGRFPWNRFAEWNGRYRDDIRRYWRGDEGVVPKLATRIAGSSDLYAAGGRTPLHSVNFVTCHDGFTLRDLVSYARKHNWANGEQNRDGTDNNLSWNSGAEGESGDAGVRILRDKQTRNLLATLLLSQGVPMLLAGDEMGRTQRGNNNAYNQDNELAWIDWRLLDENEDLVRFVRELIALRRRYPALRRNRFFTGDDDGHGHEDITWFGGDGKPVDWDDAGRCLGLQIPLNGEPYEELVMLFNATDGKRDFVLPTEPGRDCRLLIDTSLEPPGDIAPPERAGALGRDDLYQSAPQSLVVLLIRPGPVNS